VLDLEKEDGNRRPIVFHPSYLSEKYVPEVSEDKQIVIKLVIKGTVPELNTNVIAHKNYKLSDVICGKHKLIEPKPGFYSLKNWNKYKASKLSNCRNCSFHSNCRLTNELSDTDSNFKKAR
jgi:hypothetical protein